jgi:hypothetical protein
MIRATHVPELVHLEIPGPEEVPRSRAVDEQFSRNSDWLEAHWPELLPRARGKFLAVAGQQPFVAETLEEAWALARAAHPDDLGALLQYVPAAQGPRI